MIVLKSESVNITAPTVSGGMKRGRQKRSLAKEAREKYSKEGHLKGGFGDYEDRLI